MTDDDILSHNICRSFSSFATSCFRGVLGRNGQAARLKIHNRTTKKHRQKTMKPTEVTNRHHRASPSKVMLAMISSAIFALLVAQFSLDVRENFSTTSANALFSSKLEFINATMSRSSSVLATNSLAVPPPAEDTPDYYMVFSTSCSPQQNWESFVFFYHAYKVNQPGNVTRIASGCKEKEAASLIEFHNKYIQPMSHRFHMHLTPSYSSVQLPDGKQSSYKYMNKPYGLRHWMEHALGLSSTNDTLLQSVEPRVSDAIVMLLDPDMILLRPLLHDFTNEEVMFIEEEPATRVVKHGFPISQQDGKCLF